MDGVPSTRLPRRLPRAGSERNRVLYKGIVPSCVTHTLRLTLLAHNIGEEVVVGTQGLR
jgi:hypothetical protein